MRELPILFSTPMVQAILDGRKTMTRRAIKVANPDEWEPKNDCRNSEYGADVPCYIKRKLATDERGIYYPKYDVGDRLWVQETWKIDSLLRERPDYPMAIDFKAVQNGYSQAEIMCKFTPDRFDKFKKFYQKPGWQSPYFMPKEAARIWLEVTDVRVERLQEITATDALKEGISEPYACRSESGYEFEMRMGFKELWDSLNAKRGYPFEMSPWVWVIEFRRVKP